MLKFNDELINILKFFISLMTSYCKVLHVHFFVHYLIGEIWTFTPVHLRAARLLDDSDGGAEFVSCRLDARHRERWHVSLCGLLKHLIVAVYLVTLRVHARWFLPVARAKVEAESTNLHTNQRRFNGPIIGFLSTSLCFSFSLGKVMLPVCVWHN